MNILQNRRNWFNEPAAEKYTMEEIKRNQWNDDELQLDPEDLDFRDFEDLEYDRIEDK